MVRIIREQQHYNFQFVEKMSETRKDHKGRKLWNGESQRKGGKYEYKYQDASGKRKTVYSWKLAPSDTMLRGKRNDLSLREKEHLIQKELNSNLVPGGGEMTVLELVQRYLGQKRGVRHNTQANYNFVVNILKKEAFGQRRIDKIKTYDAKAWLIKLQEDGRDCFATIIANRKKQKKGPIIGGKSRFLYPGKNAGTLSARIWPNPG